MGPLVEAVVTEGVFQWRSDTLNAPFWDTLWDTSSVLHCGDGFPCVSTSSFSEDLQEIFFLWNNGKECVWGDGRGSGASTSQAFMNLGTLRFPRTNTGQFFTLLMVKPNFTCWTSMHLEQNWNCPLIAPLALSCIASIPTLYFYAKSLSCILNTSLNPSWLTQWQNSLPHWFNLLPPPPTLSGSGCGSITSCQGCQHSPGRCCGCLWLGTVPGQLPGCVFGQGAALHESLCCCDAAPLLPSAFMDYWWNSLVQFGCLIDKARMEKKKGKKYKYKTLNTVHSVSFLSSLKEGR